VRVVAGDDGLRLEPNQGLALAHVRLEHAIPRVLVRARVGLEEGASAIEVPVIEGGRPAHADVFDAGTGVGLPGQEAEQRAVEERVEGGPQGRSRGPPRGPL